MGNVRTLKFHTKYGPAPLFDKARGELKELAGLNLEIPHAKSRFDEREIPLRHLTDLQPDRWEVMTVETALRTGRITYMSLRRNLGSGEYLWIVLAYEHVMTAWITRSAKIRAADPLIVRDGPAWDAAAAGRDPKRTAAIAEWEQGRARRLRARRVLIALVTSPARPSGIRLANAARLVLAGETWNDAAAAAGWASTASMDAAIKRLLRAASQRTNNAGDDRKTPA
jgi:hypothetical protein